MISTKSNVSNRIRSEELEIEKWLTIRELLRQRILHEDGVYVDNPALQSVMQDVRQYFRADRVYSYRNLTSNVEFFNEIAPSIQNSLIQTCFNKFVKKFRIFFNAIQDVNFTKELISCLGLKIYYDTQKIIKQGAQSPGLHFILRGKVVIVYRGLPILTLGENSFFGESLLLDRNLGLEYIANDDRAHELKCLYIPRKAFLDICYRYPFVMHSLKKLAYMREDHFESTSLKRYEHVKNLMRMRLVKGIISTTNKLNLNTEKEQEGVDIDHAKSTTQDKLLPKANQNTSILQEEEIIAAAEILKEKLDLKSILEDADDLEKDLPTVTTVVQPNIVPVFEKITQNIMAEKLSQNVLSFESSEQEESSEYTPSEDSPPVKTPRRRRFTEHFEKIITRRASSKRFKSAKTTNPIVVPSVLLEDEYGGYRVNHKVVEELDHKKTLDEDNQDAEDDDEDDEDSESDRSNEDDSDLDNSMEVPLEMFEPTYEDTDEADLIIKSLKARIHTNIHKLERVKKSFREKLLEEWKKVRRIKTFKLNSITDVVTPTHSAYTHGESFLTGFTPNLYAANSAL